MAVIVKINVGLGAWDDGTWIKGGQLLPVVAGQAHQTSNKSHGGGGGGGGGGMLWKPISEGDGKLVILIGVTGGTCTVNGEVGRYVGQTNGNRATYRFSKPGAGYGTNITVVHSTAGTWTVAVGSVRSGGSKQNAPVGSTDTGNGSSTQKHTNQDREGAENPNDNTSSDPGQDDTADESEGGGYQAGNHPGWQ